MLILFMQLFGNNNDGNATNNESANHVSNQTDDTEASASYANSVQRAIQPLQPEADHSLCTVALDGTEKNPDIIPQGEFRLHFN